MKKLMIISSMLLCSYFVNAQLDKGTKLLGGSLNFATSKTTDQNSSGNTSKYTTVSFSPSIAWATKKNSFTGVSIRFGYATQPSIITGGTYYTSAKQISTGAEVFKRKYLDLGKSFHLFGHGGLGVSYDRAKNSSVNAALINKNYTAAINFYPGFAYQFNKKMMLELTTGSLMNIGFSHSEMTSTSVGSTPQKNKNNSFNLNTGLNSGAFSNIGIGFKLFLN